jgi:hypothetical protein
MRLEDQAERVADIEAVTSMVSVLAMTTSAISGATPQEWPTTAAALSKRQRVTRAGAVWDTDRTRPARQPDESPGDDERHHETFAQVMAGPRQTPHSYECVALPSELLGRDRSL